MGAFSYEFGTDFDNIVLDPPLEIGPADGLYDEIGIEEFGDVHFDLSELLFDELAIEDVVTLSFTEIVSITVYDRIVVRESVTYFFDKLILLLYDEIAIEEPVIDAGAVSGGTGGGGTGGGDDPVVIVGPGQAAVDYDTSDYWEVGY